MSEWKSVRIPKELHSLIKAISEKRNEAMHKTIAKAVGFYIQQNREFDRRTWYAFKLLLTYGDFRHNQKAIYGLEKVLYQIMKRTKAINYQEFKWIMKLANEYAIMPTPKKLGELNDEIKEVFRRVLYLGDDQNA
ncbi:MAG: hypothetical protein ACXQTI_03630 [Candidatus Nezhaarchaeales archaeon]